MPLPQEVKDRIYKANGIDPEKYDLVSPDELTPQHTAAIGGPQVNPMGYKSEPVAPPAISTTEAFGRGAAENLLPAAAGLGTGALATMGTAAGIGALGGSEVPVIGNIIGGLVGLGVGGYTAYKTHQAQKALVPQAIQQKIFTTPESQAQHPIATAGGEFTANLPFMNPIKGAANLAQLGREGIAALRPSGRAAFSPQSVETMLNVAPAAGVAAGQNIYNQVQSSEPFSVGNLAANVLPSLLLNHPTGLGRKLMFQPAEQPVLGHDAVMQELQAKRDAIAAEKETQLKAEKEAPAPVDVEEAIKEPQKKFTKQEDELQRLAAQNAGIPEDKFSTTPTISPEERASTRESIKPASDEVATRRGYQTEEVPKLIDKAGTPVAGSLKQSTRDIKLSTDETTGASGGTTSHELGHGFGYDLAHSKSERDRQHITKAFQAVTGDNNLTHAEVVAHYDNPVKGSRLFNAEEDLARLVEKGGYQQLKTDLYGTRREKLKQYAGEVANHIRVKFGKEVTPENMADFLHSRIRGDAPYGERPELLHDKPIAAPTTQTTDDTKHSEQLEPLKDAPVKYRGYQEGIGRFPSKHLYDLTEDVSPTLVKDSTVTHKQLADEGYKVPDALKAAHEGDIKHSTEPVPLDTKDEQVGDNAKKGFLRSIEAAFDKVGRHDTKVSQALHNYETQKTENEGHFVNVPETKLKDLKPTDKELLNVALYRRAKFREYDDTGKTPKALTPKEQKLNAIFQSEVSDAVREKQNELGLKVEGRDGKLREGGEDPNYIPDMMNDATKQKLINGSNSEKKSVINEMVKYGLKHSKLGEAELRKKVQDYVNVLGRRSGASLSQAEFNALRLPEGLGLPASMRETNLLTITRKYGKRAANDLAYFEHLQKPARIAAALGLKNQEGKLVTMEGVDSIANIPDVQNAMTRVTGNFSTVHQPRIMSVSRAVVNSMLQTATGIRDFVSVPNNALPYHHKIEDITAVFKAVGNLKSAIMDSLKYGARSQTLDADRWHALSNPDAVTDVANKVAEAMRKYSGRDLLEQSSRIFTFAWGKELAKLNIIRAIKGDKASKAWLEKFGTLVTDPTKATDETLNRIAKNFVDRNQGTYGGRGLPTGIDEGPLAPFMSLSRWGVEKSNVIYKDVVQPMKSGNYKPFLAYTLGSILTGAGIKQLNQFMSGKKEQNASLNESLVAGNKTEAAAAIVNLLQLGSYAGFMSDVAKMGTDVFVHHQKPSTLNFPLMAFATDTVGQGLADWSTTMEQGEDPVQASVSLAYQILKGSIQDVRLADQRFVNPEDTEKKNKYRDLRVFKTLYDYPVPQPTFGHDNTLLGEDTKKFKKTDDMSEAAALIPNLLGKALETSKNADGTVNIDKLKSKVAGLKGNSYQTIPSPEESPQEFVQYMGFLRETQGDDVARSRLVDYMVQRAKNQAKSGMLPSL